MLNHELGSMVAPKIEKGRVQKTDMMQQILRSRVFIFAMLFGVTGFLGLPFLWMSPSFSRLEKVVWSIVNTLYTCALIWITVMICVWAYHQIALSGVAQFA